MSVLCKYFFSRISFGRNWPRQPVREPDGERHRKLHDGSGERTPFCPVRGSTAGELSLHRIHQQLWRSDQKSGDGYLSTRRDGEGTGLLSISSAAKKYQDYARISHKGNEFFMDVMLKVWQGAQPRFFQYILTFYLIFILSFFIECQRYLCYSGIV